MVKRKRKQQTFEERLDDVFLKASNPGSFSGVDKVYKEVNKRGKRIGITRVRKYLSNQPPYTLHKAPIRKFSRPKVETSGMEYQWQSDLVDMSNYAAENNGYKFILTVIDVFSKLAFAKPLKNKSAKSITNAFDEILNEYRGRNPVKIQTDKGKEYMNSEFARWCKEHLINHFTSEDDDMKAQIVERFNRTLKNKMYRMFQARGNQVWYDKLHELVKSYNNTEHSSIKMAPSQVTREDQPKILSTLYPNSPFRIQNIKPQAPKIGDHVRLQMPKIIFKKGYAPQWTEEIFIITEAKGIDHIPHYKVTDLMREEIRGTFFPKQLQKVAVPNNWKINAIIERNDKQNQVKVSWKGYPEKFNSWIKTSDLKKIGGLRI